ncbi:hypothetical protein PVBG_00460 [Plasmodium vivax Brazil I]|uniref:Uncharacterized protein n=1 Tax=Plasmodium vivax (strain Brazil I) TaxID=1033975 RepID=A0A0J9SNI1_PLAV1|nr:hypothetical protein PVBG_00460 [Plasmodium vivax Brazil I]
MKEPTVHQQVRHTCVAKVPFLKNGESPHRLNIKDEVEKYERKKKNIKREMYKFMSSIRKGHKQRHPVNCHFDVFFRTAPPLVSISPVSKQSGGAIKGHSRELQKGCRTPKERNYKKKTSPCRGYPNEGDFKKHNFLWNPDGYQERGYHKYHHVFLKRKDLHCSSIFGEYSHGGGVPRWGDPGGIFPTCGGTLSGLTSPRNSLKFYLEKWDLHRQNRSGHQRGSSNCSSESTQIIDQFVKSIEGEHSGGKKKKENMGREKANFGAFPPEGTPLHGMAFPNLSTPAPHTVTTWKSKPHTGDHNASTVLSEYQQMLKGNKKMLSLLQRVMHQVEVTNGSSEVNRKIEKGISTYLGKVERMESKCREALKWDDFNKTRRLHRHFRANEMAMLRCVLNYIIDLMRHVKYECKDLRREMEREICEAERQFGAPREVVQREAVRL